MKRLSRLDLLDDAGGVPWAGWAILGLALTGLAWTLAGPVMTAQQELSAAPPGTSAPTPPARPAWVGLFDLLEAHDHGEAGSVEVLAARTAIAPPGLHLRARAPDPQALRDWLLTLEQDPRLSGVELLQQAWQAQTDGQPPQLIFEIQARWRQPPG